MNDRDHLHAIVDAYDGPSRIAVGFAMSAARAYLATLPTPDANGWIPHDGGPCPVGPDVWVQIRQKSGTISGYVPACFLYWKPVTSYRIAKENDE